MTSRLLLTLCRFREANPVFTKVEHCVVSSHEYIPKNPAVVQDNVLDCDREEEKKIFLAITQNYSAYQRGPRGGGISNAINPLMQTVWPLCSSFTMYCNRSYTD